MWKTRFKKIAGGILTGFIAVQMCLCIVLMLRSASGQDTHVFGYRFYYIVSPSMEPTIPVRSQIVVKKTDVKKLREGDIITFASKDPAIAGYPNTHRIEQIITDEQGSMAFVTKGDNNPTVDDYLVYPSEIYGKVVVIAPLWKGIIQFYSFAATPIGFAVVIVMPLLLVLGAFLRSFTKELNQLRELSEQTEKEEQDVANNE